MSAGVRRARQSPMAASLNLQAMYYIDIAGVQRGPVTLDNLRGAYAATPFRVGRRRRARVLAEGGRALPERLRVYPTAKRCIECQSQHEKTFAQSSRPSL